MKTVSQMARECGCKYSDVQNVITSNKMKSAECRGTYRLFSQIQEDFIYKTLYFERKCFILTLESKMNKPEPKAEQEPFEEFKKRVYGRKN